MIVDPIMDAIVHAAADRADRMSYRNAAPSQDAGLEGALRLAVRLCGVTVGVIAFLDGPLVRFGTRIGTELESLPANESFAGLTARMGRPLIIGDLWNDPSVEGPVRSRPGGGLRFCASVPLFSPLGPPIGALCVMDASPRPQAGEYELAALEDVACLVMDVLKERQQASENAALARRAILMRELMAVAAEALDLEGAVHAAAKALCTATSGLTCHLWRQMEGAPPRAQFTVGWSRREYDAEGYLASLRLHTVSDPASPTLRCLIENKQFIIEDIRTGIWAENPLLQEAAKRGLRTCIGTPFNVSDERYALVLGLGERREDIPELSATLIDATAALKPMLRRIREEEQTRLFRRVVEATSDAVLITAAEPGDDPGQNIVYANPAFERETGYTQAEVLGRSPRLLLGPSTSPEATAAISRAVRRFLPVRQTIRNYRKDGTTFWCDLHIAPVSERHGSVTHFVSVQRDVTADREAQMERDEAIAERDALIDHMPGVLLRLTRLPSGRWQRNFAAATMLHLTGFTPEEVAEPNWFDSHTDPADHGRTDHDANQAMLHGRVSFEFRFRHKDGRWLWIRSIKRAHLRADGQQEIVSIWSDITREKQLGERLAHAAKLAQLGEVTTGMAHELNQPLASISIAAENAKRRLGAAHPDVAGVGQKLDSIVEQTNRISALIDHMRVFGRTENLPTGPICLQEVVADALQMLAGKLKFSGATVTLSYEDGLPAIMGASIPLEQVIINLVSNACDAYASRAERASGDRPITIAAQHSSGRVVIMIEDRAGGMSDEALPRVFEPFFTTKAAGQGTGLGLSISYGIITDMKGEISVSNLKGGAAFRIELPAAP